MTASRRNFWRNTFMAAGLAAWMTGETAETQAQTPASDDLLEVIQKSEDFFGLLRNRVKPLEIEADLAEPETGGVERYGGNGYQVVSG